MREKPNTNPAGKHGKPFTLAPHSFDDAIRKILATPPEPKADKSKPKKKLPHPKQ